MVFILSMRSIDDDRKDGAHLMKASAIHIYPDELHFDFIRASGPGGQNVNKVSSKVELRYNLLLTSILTQEEKEMIFVKLKNKINKENEIILVSQSERSQLMNKIAVTEKFYDLISKALTVPIKRKNTRPTLSSKLRRLDLKRNRSDIKKLRKQSGDSSNLQD